MLYITDISSADVQHEQFNSSFIELLQKTYPGEALTFAGETKHVAILRKKLSGISFKEIFVYTQRGGFKEFIRAYNQYKTLNKLIGSLDSKTVSSLYILLIHPFAHFLFSLFGSGKIPVVIVKHGELESVKFNKHFLNKIWGVFQKFALSRSRRNISYVILGKSIYKNLIEILPAFSRQSAIVLDHPYPFRPAQKKSMQSPLVFSTLGVATKAKNTHYFFALAREAKQKGLSYHFNVCGRVYKNMEPYLHDNVKFKPGYASLSREELNGMIQESDFTVFYYENSDYSLCASGSFWDAVNAEIPMLYVRNDYFEYYSNLAGPLGIAFESPEDLNQFILTTPINTLAASNEYNNFVANIVNLKYKIMSTENLSRQLTAGINQG